MAFPAVVKLHQLDGTDGFRLEGERDTSGYGARAVGAAGDINGDGFDDLIIGLPSASPHGYASRYAGSTFLVFGKAGGFDGSLHLARLDGTDGFRLDCEVPFSQIGYSVSGAGDINGDGFDDVVVGAPRSRNAGASYVLFGKAGGFEAASDIADLNGDNGFRIDGAFRYDRSGRSVSSAGDVNGDGLGDLIVGADGFSSAGAAYVVLGHQGGFGGTFKLRDLDGENGCRLDGDGVGAATGWWVSGAGDFNGDGFDDVFVGGRVAYVVFGRAGGLPPSIALADLDGSDGFLIEGGGDRSARDAGDINGDGLADLLIGGSTHYGTLSHGSAYVVFGRKGGVGPSIDVTRLDGRDGFRLDGITAPADNSVSGAGDVNGDGLDDIVIGSPTSKFSGPSAGSSFVVFGRASGFAAHVDLTTLDGTSGFRLDGAAGDHSGTSVSAAGDLNGDGLGDLVVAAPEAEDPENTPEFFVVFGQRAGPLAGDAAAAPRGAPALVDVLANDDPGIVGDPTLVTGPAHGTALVTDGGAFLYLPDLGFAGSDTFAYEASGTTGAPATAAVHLTVGFRPASKGTDSDDPALAGAGGDDLLLGLGGDDALAGGRGEDAIYGGGGRDRLAGGDGDDVLLGGAERNLLRGGGGADLFVLDGAGRQVILDFDAAQGDVLAITVGGLLEADGRLDGSRVGAFAAGDALLLRADLDGDGSFELLLARVAGVAGLGLDDLLMNAVA